MHVLIDDCRNGGDVIIRHPEVAIVTLRRLMKQITCTYWDNDMGGGWEMEGRNLLKQFLQDCANAKHCPPVVIVTSNIVAQVDMRNTLFHFGYKATCHPDHWIHPSWPDQTIAEKAP